MAQSQYDVELVKPIVNFNIEDGGYYSAYNDILDTMYCGAVVRNIGSDSINNAYVELSYLDYDNSVMYKVYSDTLQSIEPGKTDTLSLKHEFPSLWRFSLAYSVKCESPDENESNNSDTIPTSYNSMGDWSGVARSRNNLTTLDIKQIEGFRSGDFIGVTYSTYSVYWNYYVFMIIYLNQELPNGAYLVGKIYKDSILVDSTQRIDHGQGWMETRFKKGGEINPGEKIFFGFDIYYQDGATIPIGIDTANFHNFQVETISRIGNTWSTLDFVPLIELICNPEGVESINNSNSVHVFPNPTSGYLHIVAKNLVKIYLFDSRGVLIDEIKAPSDNDIINLNSQNPGFYFIRLHTPNEIFMQKIIKY